VLLDVFIKRQFSAGDYYAAKRPRTAQIKCLDMEYTQVNIGPDIQPPAYALTDFWAMNLVKEGNALQTRQGNKIAMKSVEIRGSLIIRGVCGNALLRYIVVYDRQPNGAVPSYGDIFAAHSYDWLVPGLPTYDRPFNFETGLEMPNLNNRDRFLILADDQFYVNAQTTTYQPVGTGFPTGGQDPIYFDKNQSNPFNYKKYIKLSSLTTTFRRDPNGFNDMGCVTVGALYFIPLVITCNQNVGANSALQNIQVMASSRLRFYDV